MNICSCNQCDRKRNKDALMKEKAKEDAIYKNNKEQTGTKTSTIKTIQPPVLSQMDWNEYKKVKEEYFAIVDNNDWSNLPNMPTLFRNIEETPMEIDETQ